MANEGPGLCHRLDQRFGYLLLQLADRTQRHLQAERVAQQRPDVALAQAVGAGQPKPARWDRRCAATPPAASRPLLGYASHFHVRGGRKGRLQTRFGANVIDYERIITQLGKRKYRGWIGLEYVWQDWERCKECDNLCETILFRDFFRKLAA